MSEVMAQKRLFANENDRKTLGNKKQQKPESNLFQDDNYPFYFDPSIEKEMRKYKHKVFMNSGSTVPKLEYIVEKKIDPKSVYCIIPDGRSDLATTIKDAIGDKAIMYSHRWIDYCIERHAVITNARERAMINLLPLPNVTPYPSLQDYKVAVRKQHFDLDRAASLEALISILGFQIVTSSSKE